MAHDYAYGVRTEGFATIPLATWARMVRILPEVSAGQRSGGQVVAYDERAAFDPDTSYSNFTIPLEVQTLSGEAPDVYEQRSAILELFGTTRLRKYLVRTAPFQGTVEIPFVVLSSPSTTDPRSRLAIALQTLEPFWRGPEVTSVNPVPTLNPAGDAPVRDAVITLSGGTDQLLTNTLTGDTIQVEGSSATPVIIDIGARTVTQGGSPAGSSVEFGGPRWMSFEPQSQLCTLTGGGSASIDYFPKWR